MTKDDAVPVTAEDREAAWPHRPECYRGGGRTRENWDAGIYDHIPLLQAFARHRGSTAGVDVEALRKALVRADALIRSIQQRPVSGLWFVAADDPEKLVCETDAFVSKALASLSQTPATPMVQEGLREALERLSELTPFSANAASVEDFAATVHAIADTALSATPAPPVDETDRLPADVRRLVIAAREIAFNDWDGDSEEWEVARKELDQASEAFASRVSWHDEPLADRTQEVQP